MAVSVAILDPACGGWTIERPGHPEKQERGRQVNSLSSPASVPFAEPAYVPIQEEAEGPSDAEVVASCLAGDKEVFSVLVERYQKRAFWVAYNLLGNAEESQDVTQDAFVRAFRSLGRFDPQRKFYTWFYRIVANLAIDRLRRKSVARAVALEDLGDSIAGGSDPGEPLEQGETRRLVRETLDSLPPKFKAVIVLRDIEGLSCKEIAPVLGTTHATVRWRLHRARQMFREKWERRERGGSE
jgi:RNA polymerase sigma-70 factor (ECF subfamily)